MTKVSEVLAKMESASMKVVEFKSEKDAKAFHNSAKKSVLFREVYDTEEFDGIHSVALELKSGRSSEDGLFNLAKKYSGTLPKMESNSPSTKSTYLKIKDMSLTALKGYARAVKLPNDIQRDLTDPDEAIIEIMGYLHGDNWESVLIKDGVL